MHYDEIAIRRAGGETKIEEALKNHTMIKLSSHDEQTIILMYGLENYIIKYWYNPKTPELAKLMQERIYSLIDIFESHPEYINYSHILSDKDVLRKIVQNPILINKYKNGYRNLYNNWENTFNKIMNNQPVSEQERTYLFSYLIRCINFEKNQDKNQRYMSDKIQKYIEKKLQENTIPTNDIEKLFIFNYCSRFVFNESKYPNEKRTIRLMNIVNNDGSFTGGYQLESFIAMNDHPCKSLTFYHTLDQMIQCVMHETTHAIQEIEARKNPDSVHGMEMAIQKLFGQKEYETGENYLFNEIEEDAQRNGYHLARILYLICKNSTVANKLFDEEQNYIKNRRFQYEYVTITENGQAKRISKEKYNVTNIREVVRKNPDLLNQYPSLTNLFYQNGQPKEISTILCEDFRSHEINKMYTDFLLYDIQHGGLDNLDLSSKTPKQKMRACKRLIDLLKGEVRYISDTLKDVEYRKKYGVKTEHLYKYHLRKALIISEFLNKNLTWMHQYEKNNKNNSNNDIFTDYSYTIRGLMECFSKSYQDGTIGNLRKCTDDRASQFKFLEDCILNEYMYKLIGYFNYEDQEKPIIYNNVTYKNLIDFVFGYVRKHINRNHYMVDENGHLIGNENGIAYDGYHFIKEAIKNSLAYRETSSRKIS